MLIAFSVFWMVTGRLEPLLLGAAGTLINAGSLAEVYLKLRSPATTPTPPPIAPSPDKGDK